MLKTKVIFLYKKQFRNFQVTHFFFLYTVRLLGGNEICLCEDKFIKSTF